MKIPKLILFFTLYCILWTCFDVKVEVYLNEFIFSFKMDSDYLCPLTVKNVFVP
jgi:hypothetical protein